MRTALLALAALSIAAVAVPASAEEFRVRAGEDGVGVKVGRDHDEGRGEGRREWREGRGDHCRTIIVKHRTPDGNVVIRKTRRCD